MKTRWIVILILALFGFARMGDAGGNPGTPIAWTNPGTATVVLTAVVSGIGPIEIFFGQEPSPTTCQAGDVVLLTDPNGGNNPTNWMAVARFFNPSDPTGSNGLAATESKAIFPADLGSNGFANFQLFANNVFTGTTSYDEFGPADAILAGQTLIETFLVTRASADLSLSASAAPQTVAVGSNLVYTITITNLGLSLATGVVISNQIPANFTFVSATGGALPTNGVLFVNVGTLAVGASNSVQIVVQPTAEFAVNRALGQFTLLTNIFAVFADQSDPAPTNNSASVISAVLGPPIPGPPIAWTNPGGQTVTTFANVSGLGPIQIGAGIPTASTCEPGDLVLLTDPNGGEDPTNWAAVARFFNPGDPMGSNGLAATKSQSFFPSDFGSNGFAGFKLFVNAVFFPASLIESSAGITSVTGFYTETGPSDGILVGQQDTDAVTVTTPAADLSLSGVTLLGPVTLEGNLIYTITVSNTGPQTATGIIVSNQLPDDTTFFEAYVQTNFSSTATTTNFGDFFFPTNGILLMNLGSLAPGNRIVFTVFLQPTAVGQITNAFEVFADENDPKPANNLLNTVAIITNPPPTGIPGTPYAGTWLNDFVPGGITFFGAEVFGSAVEPFAMNGSPVSFAVPGDFVMLNDPTGGNNPTNWLAVARFSNPNDPTGTNGLLATQNQAFFPTDFGVAGFANFKLFPNVTFSQGFVNQPEPGETSATYTEIGPVAGLGGGNILIMSLAVTNGNADLSLTASGSTGIPVGSNLVYSVTISNAGPLAATGVVISNRIPAGTTFVSATGGASPTNDILLVNLGTLAAGATNLVQIVVKTTSSGLLTNVFQVFASELDPNLTNNSATVLSDVLGLPFPGTPIAWTNPGGQTLNISAVVSGSGPIDVSGSGEPPATSCQAGDVILITDPNGGDNPTNWTAVARFFNPSDPTGSNGLAATESEAIFAADLGSNGFANFQLLSNNIFLPVELPETNNGVVTVESPVKEFGPAGAILSGQAMVEVFQVTRASADLSLSVSAAPQSVTVGSNLVYTITVSNAGPSAATGVAISVQFSANEMFFPASGGAFPVNDVGMVNLGTLAAGATNIVQIVLHTLASGQITNLFQVSAGVFDPDLANNSATAVSMATNVAIVVHGIPGTPVNWDDPTTETAIISEVGGFVAGPIVSTFGSINALGVISSALPGDVVLLTDPNGGNNPTNWAAVLRFFNPDDPAGSNGFVATEVQAFFQTNVAGGAGFANFSLFTNVDFLNTTTFLSGIIEATWTEFGPVAGVRAGQQLINTINLSEAVPITDLSLSANAAPEPVAVGSNLVYTVSVTNLGPQAMIGVVVSNQIPAGVTFISATGGATPTNGTLLVNLGTLAVSASSPVQIVVQPTAAGTLTNAFEVSALGGDPNLTNNSVTVVSTVTNAPVVNLGFPGTPYNNGNWTFTNTASSGGGTDASILFSALIGIAAQPFQINFSDDGVGSIRLVHLSPPTNAIPGDIVMLRDSNAGNNPTNWMAVARFFNPNDPTGINELAATEEQGFFPDTPGLNGFTNFTLLPNVYFLGAESGSDGSQVGVVDVEIGPFAGLQPGEVGIFTITVSNSIADLSLSASAAPEPAGVGSNLVYSLTLSNAGPQAATGVIISNHIPAGVTFISATGGATPLSGILLLNLGTLANGAATSAQVIVRPTITGPLTNFFQVSGSQLDSNLTNNSATVVSTVTNAPPPSVDVALSITATPNPVNVGAPLTYSLTVTNKSLTLATGVTVSNTLPPNVTFISDLPSQGTATDNGGVVTFTVGNLTNGVPATLAVVVIPNAAGSLTNAAIVSSAQTDSQPTNNSVSVVTTAVTAPITNLVLTVLPPIKPTLNPQTGLFQQQVEVSNGGPSTPSSVLVLVSGLATNAVLYNATGVTNGLPFVQSAAPLGVGSNVVFTLEYYVPTRVTPTNLTLIVQAGPVVIPPVVTGTITSVKRAIVLANGSVLVEFSAVPGQIYAIQYSSDMVTWLTAVPVITAPANEVQWIDDGPPKTVTNPAQQTTRYYRVVLLPAR